MKERKDSFFWASYADLMTTLFFVMLVLFMLTIVLYHKKLVEIDAERQASQAQMNKIREIEKAVNEIDSLYFSYNTKFKKHILKIRVNFPAGQSEMHLLSEKTQSDLIDAGRSIQLTLESISLEYPNIKYLLVIEGQASKDQYIYNYELSYLRALELNRFWSGAGIDFGDNCEVLLSGSGTGGILRDSIESVNQRFLIHIVPKPGVIDESK